MFHRPGKFKPIPVGVSLSQPRRLGRPIHRRQKQHRRKRAAIRRTININQPAINQAPSINQSPCSINAPTSLCRRCLAEFIHTAQSMLPFFPFRSSIVRVLWRGVPAPVHRPHYTVNNTAMTEGCHPKAFLPSFAST